MRRIAKKAVVETCRASSVNPVVLAEKKIAIRVCVRSWSPARVLTCRLCSSPSSASAAPPPPPPPPLSPPPSAFADLPPVKAPADFDDHDRHEESGHEDAEQSGSTASMRIIQVTRRRCVPVARTTCSLSSRAADLGGQGERQQQQRRPVQELGTREDRARRAGPDEESGHQHRRRKGRCSLSRLVQRSRVGSSQVDVASGSGAPISGIFIKNVLPDSPAGRTGQLKVKRKKRH